MRHHIKLKLYGANEHLKKQVPDSFKSFFPQGEYFLNTDSDGYISFPGFQKRQNSMFMLGDSFMESSYVPEGQRITDLINKKYGEALNMSFYNAGMSGSSLLHFYNLFINKIFHLPYSNIFLFPGSISSSCLYLQGGFWSDSSRYSNLTDQTAQPKWHYSKCDGESFTRIFHLFKHAASLSGTGFFLALTPYNRGEDGKTVNTAMDAMHELTRSFAAKENVPLLDLDTSARENHVHFYDDCHVHPAGAAHYADVIGKFLLSAFKCEKSADAAQSG